MVTVARAPRPQHRIDEYDVLGTPPSRDLQALVDLAAQVCGVPMAAINLLTTHEQHMVATSGVERSVCDRQDSMCAVVAEVPDTVVVADASRDARFADNPFVSGALDRVRFYASAPLVTPEGIAVGRLCVFDTSPRDLGKAQQEALGTLAVRVIDILELRLRGRQLEASLQELTAVRDELQRSNRHLSRFAEQVSHDLRTPLTAILTNAELLCEEPAVDDHGLQPMVEGILRSGRRMGDLIHQVLLAARLGDRPGFVPTPLGEVFDRVLDDLAPTLAQTAAQVEVAELPTVVGNPDLLYAVGLNLLTNALKFVRPGVVPHVRVAAERRTGGWRVSITDNGVGIDAMDPQEMFLRFARGTTDVHGTGLGLSTTKRIVETHGGSVGLEPAPGGGTTAWFALPD